MRHRTRNTLFLLLATALLLFAQPATASSDLVSSLTDSLGITSEQASGAGGAIFDAAERFLGSSPEWLGWVPADQAVGRSVERRRPVVLEEPGAPSSRVFALLAAWEGIDAATSVTPFYERAREALR